MYRLRHSLKSKLANSSNWSKENKQKDTLLLNDKGNQGYNKDIVFLKYPHYVNKMALKAKMKLLINKRVECLRLVLRVQKGLNSQ